MEKNLVSVNKSLDLLVCPSTNAKILQSAFIIADEISQRVFIRFIQPDYVVFFIE